VLAASPAKSALVHQETGPLRSRILDQYQKWKGTQYQWGGTTHRGVDCSALMQHLFSDAAHLNLPRTTSEQIHRGVQVAQYRLSRRSGLLPDGPEPQARRRLYWQKPVYSCLKQPGRNGFNPDG
jgi:cell wall-associated NlpC family hydrolase